MIDFTIGNVGVISICKLFMPRYTTYSTLQVFQALHCKMVVVIKTLVVGKSNYFYFIKIVRFR